MQIDDDIQGFAYHTGLSSVAVYGGAPADSQERALRAGVDIVVATPGRLMDHMRSAVTDFSGLDVLVLDEADRMMDMGFWPDITRIVSELPTSRRTFLFSATMPEEVMRRARAITRDAVMIESGVRNGPARTIHHTAVMVPSGEKTTWLARFLRREAGPVLVFVRTKVGADRVASRLIAQGIRTTALHADRTQQQRSAALEGSDRAVHRAGRHRRRGPRPRHRGDPARGQLRGAPDVRRVCAPCRAYGTCEPGRHGGDAGVARGTARDERDRPRAVDHHPGAGLPAGRQPLASRSRRVSVSYDDGCPDHVAGVAALAAAVSVAAAGDSGVRGRVRDPEGLPLPGVAITVTAAPPAPLPRSGAATTDAQGVFFVPLPSGTYRVRADLSGFDPVEQAVTVSAGEVAELNLQMRLAGVKEQVTVKGDTPQPVLGTPSPAAPVTATREVVDSGMLPNSRVRRRAAAAAQRRARPRRPHRRRRRERTAGRAARERDRPVDPITGEAVLLLPLEAVDSVDVFSGGYTAEAGRATGGVTSVHTLAGGDKRRWSANSFFPRIKFFGDGPHGVDSWEPNVGLSGPLLGGRLSVEQAVSYRYDRNRFETLWGEQESTYSAFMSWTQADWRVSDRNHVVATMSFDPQRDTAAGITAFTAAASAPELRRGG